MHVSVRSSSMNCACAKVHIRERSNLSSSLYMAMATYKIICSFLSWCVHSPECCDNMLACNFSLIKWKKTDERERERATILAVIAFALSSGLQLILYIRIHMCSYALMFLVEKEKKRVCALLLLLLFFILQQAFSIHTNVRDVST